MKKALGVLGTLVVASLAVWLAWQLWGHYQSSPWTRDGRIRADIIKVAAPVSGPVLAVVVRDNQAVSRGDLLLQIDPAPFELGVNQAQARADAQHALWQLRSDEAKGAKAGATGAQQVQVAWADYQQALVQLEQARLLLTRTQVRASVDGFVTNLDVHVGDFAREGEPKLALVDQHSFWVSGYFEETQLPQVQVGALVEVRLLSGERLKGHVDSISRGVYDRDNRQSAQLLADVSPTFNWVRLAQRVPVRIHLDEVPDGLLLAAGMSCTLVVHPRPAP